MKVVVLYVRLKSRFNSTYNPRCEFLSRQYDPKDDILPVVTNCYVEKDQPSLFRLVYSPSLLWVIAISMGINSISMVLVILLMRQQPLLTVGYVMESYLRFPDEHKKVFGTIEILE